MLTRLQKYVWRLVLPDFSQPLACCFSCGSPLHPPGVSRLGGSPAARYSGHAMVWAWYGRLLEFMGRALHGGVTVGMERVRAPGMVTAGSRRTRRWATRPPLAVVTYAYLLLHRRLGVSDRRISGYQCRLLNGSTPRSGVTASHVGPRRLRGGAGSLPAGGTSPARLTSGWGGPGSSSRRRGRGRGGRGVEATGAGGGAAQATATRRPPGVMGCQGGGRRCVALAWRDGRSDIGTLGGMAWSSAGKFLAAGVQRCGLAWID